MRCVHDELSIYREGYYHKHYSKMINLLNLPNREPSQRLDEIESMTAEERKRHQTFLTRPRMHNPITSSSLLFSPPSLLLSSSSVLLSPSLLRSLISYFPLSLHIPSFHSVPTRKSNFSPFSPKSSFQKFLELNQITFISSYRIILHCC